MCFPTDAELKHTLGNLTLFAGSLNPALSRSPWEVKKAELLRCSQPGLSRELHALEDWAEREILARGQVLAEVACGVWRYLGGRDWIGLISWPEIVSRVGNSRSDYPPLASVDKAAPLSILRAHM